MSAPTAALSATALSATAPDTTGHHPLLAVDEVTVGYGGRHAPPVLADAILSAQPGEIVGIIGETGSGKTTLARAVAGLVPLRAGRVVFDGVEISALRGRELRAFRRTGRLQFVFQDPLRALDPELTVAESVGEPLAVAGVGSKTERRESAAEAVRAVGLDDTLLDRHPGRLSGGQRQRVLLARSLVTKPALLICDEPVSALDAANRGHVLRLLADLRDTTATTVLVISHDLPSLAGVADRVAVLHQGRIVEDGPVRQVLEDPRHAYTARLVAAAPRLRREHLLSARPTPTA
ncbi:ABC transporter ATP-binding protein [Catenulispora rubra]|uniref:ABC transporter ATP-binding protein n=1 Tax=Catenulispora rubra TaxID=280293 RepID=UPI001891FB1F|nr:ATP-binding cassette domain-containing protein [Catenulispora rubra]